MADSSRDEVANKLESIAKGLQETAYYYRRNDAPNAKSNLYRWSQQLEDLSDRV